MARFYPSGGAGGGVSSDELTANLSDVVKGKTVVAGDTGDEIGTGTLELTGNAGTGDVVKNKGFYTTDPKTKQAGTLEDKNGTTQAAAASLDTTNSRVQMAIPVLGRYNTSSKLYVAFATLASLIGLTAAKLISGNTILGIAGTATNDATVNTTKQIRKGVIAYGKNGVKYVGDMTEKAAATITPSKAEQYIAAGTYCAGKQTIKAIPSNYVDITGEYSLFKSGTFGSLSGGAVKGYASGSLNSPLEGTVLSATVTVGDTIVLWDNSSASPPKFVFKKSIKLSYYNYVKIVFRIKNSTSRRIYCSVYAFNVSTQKQEGVSSSRSSEWPFVDDGKNYWTCYEDTWYTMYIDITDINTESFLMISMGADYGTDSVTGTTEIQEVTLIP